MPVQFHCSQCRRTLSIGQRKAGATVACPKCGAPNVVPRLEPASATPAAETILPSNASPAFPEVTGTGSPTLPEAIAFDEIPDLIAMIDSIPVAAAPARESHAATSKSSAGQAPAGRTPTPPIAEASAGVNAAPATLPVVSPAPPPVMSPPPMAGSPSSPDVGLPANIQSRLAVSSATSAATSRRVLRRRRDETMLLVSRKAVYAQAALMAVIALAALAAGYLIGRGSQRAAENSEAAPAASLSPTR